MDLVRTAKSFCGPRVHASSRQLRHASPRDECLHASHAAPASSKPNLASSKDLADLLASSGGVCARRPDVTTLAENDHSSLATGIVPCALQGRSDAATLRRQLSDVVFGQGHDSPMREPIELEENSVIPSHVRCERCQSIFQVLRLLPPTSLFHCILMGAYTYCLMYYIARQHLKLPPKYRLQKTRGPCLYGGSGAGP